MIYTRPLVTCFVGGAITERLKDEDQVVRGACRPDQPSMEPTAAKSPLRGLFPCGSKIMTSSIWALVFFFFFKREEHREKMESITSASVCKCSHIVSLSVKNTHLNSACVIQSVYHNSSQLHYYNLIFLCGLSFILLKYNTKCTMVV